MTRATIPERLYRALLRLFPAEFRGDFGDQMADDFRDQHDEMARRGRPWRLWARTIADVVGRAPREHADILWRDVAYAVRQLRRRPGVSLGAIATLAIGLGLNTTVFALASAVLWRSLPFANGDRLVAIHDVRIDGTDDGTSVSAANFVDWELQTRTLEAMSLVGSVQHTLLDAGDPEHLSGARVSRQFFRLVPMQPARGRLFTDADYAALGATAAGPIRNDHETDPGIAVISYELWQRLFGGRDDAIGRKVRLGQSSVEIVGVLPRGFVFPGSEDASFWQPMAPDAQQRRARYLSAFGRLADGTSLGRAQAELDVISTGLAARYPRANKDYRVRLVPLRDAIASGVRGHLWLLLGAAASVLLIACASIGNLLLAQASGRRLEFATRSALGASRMHLIRQTLTESLVLAGLGGALALLLAYWALPALVKLAPPDTPRLSEFGIDGIVLAFTAISTAVVGLLCGAIAAFAATASAKRPIRHAAGVDGRSRGRRFRVALAVAQIAVALALAIGAGLLVRTLRVVAGLDLGFVPTNVLSVGLTPQSKRYQEPGRKAEFEAELEARVRSLPGVVAAGIGSRPLGFGGFGNQITIVGDTERTVGSSVDVVGPGYLEAIGARLSSGRFIEPRDAAGGQLVVVINTAAARAWWPGASPLGRFVLIDSKRIEVVGVLADVRRAQLEEDPSPTVYLPTAQTMNMWTNNLVVRTSGDARAILPAIRGIMRSIDREQALARITTLEDSLAQATAPRRNLLWLVGFFSLMALGLAALGVYGVVAESVAQRVPEFGVRMALGATKASVMLLILRQGAWLIASGTAIGLAAALAFNRVMANFVFRVPTTDIGTYVAACLGIALATLVASALPAGRAARIDPVVALRTE